MDRSTKRMAVGDAIVELEHPVGSDEDLDTLRRVIAERSTKKNIYGGTITITSLQLLSSRP